MSTQLEDQDSVQKVREELDQVGKQQKNSSYLSDYRYAMCLAWSVVVVVGNQQ